MLKTFENLRPSSYNLAVTQRNYALDCRTGVNNRFYVLESIKKLNNHAGFNIFLVKSAYERESAFQIRSKTPSWLKKNYKNVAILPFYQA
jgi:hypothetical protein